MSKNSSNLITIKVNSIAKEKLDNLKKHYVFSSFSVAIEAMCSFFEINKISPKEGVIQNYHNSIFNVEKAVKLGLLELKKQYNKDSQSMRKLLRGIEKDHMIGVSTKVSYLFDKEKEKNVNNNMESTFNSMIKSSEKELEKDKEIELLKEEMESKIEEIKTLKYATNNESILLEKYRETIKEIYQKYQLEKGAFGKEKIVIDMPKEKFDSLIESLVS